MQNSHVSILDPKGPFLTDTMPFKGPQPHLKCCFHNFNTDSRSLSDSSRQALKSHNCVKKTTETLMVCVSKKPTYFNDS